MTFDADIDSVAYGVATQVTGTHLSKFIEDKGIKVLNCAQSMSMRGHSLIKLP